MDQSKITDPDKRLIYTKFGTHDFQRGTPGSNVGGEAIILTVYHSLDSRIQCRYPLGYVNVLNSVCTPALLMKGMYIMYRYKDVQRCSRVEQVPQLPQLPQPEYSTQRYLLLPSAQVGNCWLVRYIHGCWWHLLTRLL